MTEILIDDERAEARRQREEKIRERSRAIISNVLHNQAGRDEVSISLAIGAACPYGLQSDRNIWLSVLHEIRGAK